ncbi:MAG: DHHA1 domain-containing protein, partial [Nanoarchaeota archaeon]
EIINSMRWYDQNKNSSLIIKGNGYLIINAQDQIRPTLAGTLASMVSRSNGIKEKFILSMAQIADGTTKVSLRMSGNDNEMDLKQIIASITKDMPNCEAGGHANAAGALIPTDLEEEFIKKAKVILEKNAMEEVVRL